MRRLRPPGLRVRLVLALLLTSAVTLAVAALTRVAEFVEIEQFRRQ